MPMHRDERRGHFLFELTPTAHHKRELIGCNLGPVLHLTTSGAHLTPEEARTLAEALTWWADRTDDSELVELAADELDDLFDLLQQEAS